MRTPAAAILLLGLAAPGNAGAKVLTVCRVNCSHNTVQGAINAAQPGDTIQIADGVYRESLLIDRDLTLQGESTDGTILDGEGPTTVVVVAEGVNATITGVTITNGVGNSGGTTNDAGGVYNRGTLTLSQSVVEGNVAPETPDGKGKGGGIRNDGTLTIRSCVLTDNQAAGSGGAIYNRGELSLELTTLCENTGSSGGGIFNETGVLLNGCTIVNNVARRDGGGILSEDRLSLLNCTVTGNNASGNGGGLWVGGSRVGRTQTLATHCTITDNSAGAGGGIFNETIAAVDLHGSIVADNDAGADCAGVMRSLGFNLDSDNTCSLVDSGESPDRPDVHAGLSQLGFHGGRTLTHALLPGSPAIDAGGTNCPVAVDQRGEPRTAGGRCDIGAYERPGCDRVEIVAGFRRGDVNADGFLDISDPVFLLITLFVQNLVITCDDAADANDDGSIEISDAIFLLNSLFLDAPGVSPPRICGADPTADALGCASERACAGSIPGQGADPAPAGGPGQPRYQDLWTSGAELALKPISGSAWESVWTAAQESCAGEATVANQDSNTNVQILAAAIVSVRLAAEDPSTAGRFRERVVAALERLVGEGNPIETHGCPFGCGKAVNETLAWGRQIGAYVLAADLVRYRTASFETWLRDMAERFVACDGYTMLESFRRRPNNWGMMNFSALVAIYAYLGDEAALLEIRERIVQGLTVGIPDCVDVPDGVLCYNWGGSLSRSGKDLTWHCTASRLLLIAPDCNILLPDGTSVNLNGLIPDDQRRSCSFCPPGRNTAFCNSVPPADRCLKPEPDTHITDWIDAAVMGARIFDRIGMGIWDVGDQAFKRMIIAHLVTHCQLTCDDNGFLCRSLYNCKDWVLPVLDEVYDLQAALTPPPQTDCNCPLVIAGRGAGASKNAGFGAYIVP